MTNEERDLERLVQAIRSSPKYRAVSPEVIRSIGAAELSKRDKWRQSVKATKNKLHQVAAAYHTGELKYDPWLRALRDAREEPASFRTVCADIMSFHSSTRERLPYLDQFYHTLLSDIPKIGAIADLGCGLNPLAIPWMPLPPDASYYACDIFEDQILFLNSFFSLAAIPGRAELCDLVNGPMPPAADVALLLKIIPCLEQMDKSIGQRLIQTIPARVLIISYPVHSLSGRDKGMLSHYASHFEALIDSLDRGAGKDRWRQTERFEFASEVVYRMCK